MKKFLTLLLIATMFLVGSVAYAQLPASPAPTGQQPASPAPASTTPNTSSSSSGFLLSVKLQNPLKVSTIGDAVKFFVNTLIKIAIPVIVVFFLWAGLKFILAQGNQAELTKAKNIFWYTIIGTLLILGAWTITNAIIGTVNSLVS